MTPADLHRGRQEKGVVRLQRKRREFKVVFVSLVCNRGRNQTQTTAEEQKESEGVG